MILYHKNINSTHYIDNLGHTRKCLSEWSSDATDRYCFYYNNADNADNVVFEKSLDQPQIDFLKKHQQIKVLYDFCGEPLFNVTELLNIVDTVGKWRLCNNQVLIIALDTFQETFINKILKKSQKNAIVKVITYNLYLDMLTPNNVTSTVDLDKKKFSILCRRHRPWRTYLFSEIVDNELLDCFHFSYHGIDNIKKLTTSSIINDIFNFCEKSITKKFKTFLHNRPYSLDNIEGFFSCAENYINNSDIHIVIEHAAFDEKNTKTEYKERYFALIDASGNVCSVGPSHAFNVDFQSLFEIDIEIFENVCSGKITLSDCKAQLNPIEIDLDLTQDHFISEKTYKPIVLGKPFIVFSDQGYLTALKTLGFATFAPFIDESYDHEPDPAHRVESVVNEIKRINELAPDQYQTLITECNKIAVHNQMIFEKLKKQNRLEF